ncbi:9881_t:CDS:2, partial [Ambispora leptoticha]
NDIIISLTGLEQSNQPDPSKRWIDFKDVFLRDAFKTVKRDIARYRVEDHHVLKIIKERHRHQREKYLKQQNSVLDSQDHARMRENGRIEFKVKQRKKRFYHLQETNIEHFTSLLPIDISRNQTLKDIKKIMEDRTYHSDESLETDEEAANEKCRLGIYIIPEKEQDKHNHIVKVVDKKWCSSKESANVNSSTSSPLRTPEWCISCLYNVMPGSASDINSLSPDNSPSPGNSSSLGNSPTPDNFPTPGNFPMPRNFPTSRNSPTPRNSLTPRNSPVKSLGNSPAPQKI